MAPAASHSGLPNLTPASASEAASIPASPARATRFRSSARKAGMARIWGPISLGQGASTVSRSWASIWSWEDPVTSSTPSRGTARWVRQVATTW